MRVLLSAAVMLSVAACALLPQPSGRLILSNFNYERVHVQAVVTANPDCAVRDAAVAVSEFDLPLNATHVVEAAPGTDVCWRIIAGARGAAPAWNRSLTASGRAIDARL